ncbi:hypothetical protein DVH24_030365 [Malus domestica]|uniref:DUF7903 domain-containing protein n=1 Tax=Malus domestica TaxID=3750 RepID=A0A498K4X8_MALDO|nr:hypothetical protein DVH24_030365 [Malus domestica]
MAYVPPHKRHSKEPERPLLTPELLAPPFKKNLNVKPYNKSNVEWTVKIVYADHSTSRWLTIGLDDENQFLPSVNLMPIYLESTEPKVGENRLALINTSLDNEGDEVKWNLPRSPGVSITENVLEDLVSSFKHVKNEMKCAKLKEVNPTLIARVGKVLFRRSPSIDMESIRKNLCPEILKQLRKSFYTNIPVSYKENIVNEVVPKIGVDFEEEKDTFQIKVELNQLRNMVTDISCTTKSLVLRLMLCTKRLVTDLTDDEMQSIRDLFNSAILDPYVKGGLRWPLGKESSGDKYKVVGVWHVIANTYKNSSLRLKEENVEVSSISEVLKEDVQLIWDNFLSCKRFLTRNCML